MIYLSHKTFTADELADLRANIGSVLSAAELTDYSSFRISKRQDEYLASRAALKDLVLSHGLRMERFCRNKLQVCKQPSGVPYLKANGQQLPGWISLSHSNGHIFAGYSPDDIRFGVDIERIESRADEFIMDFFTPAEQKFLFNLSAAEKPLYATLAWSVKESVLKAFETGLGIDTRSLEIRFPPDISCAEGWNRADLSGSRMRIPAIRSVWHRSGDFILTVCAPENETLVLNDGQDSSITLL